jgi:hypothetical protein
MKEPIEPSEIRAGDLIRWEYEGDADSLSLTACEGRVKGNGQRLSNQSGQHYLLDRPTVFPKTVTLGWIVAPTYRQLGRWKSDDTDDAAEFDCNGDRVNTWYGATAFTPATAVPTDALEKLRATQRFSADVGAFLAAVDEAQS